MQYSFLGFSVKKIIEFGLDIKDLAVLRYFDDFRESGRMNYETIEGEKYYWVSYQSFAKEMPYLGLEKRSIMARMLKLRDLGILNHYTKKEGGTFSYFKLGNKFYELFDNNNEAKLNNNIQFNNDVKSNYNEKKHDYNKHDDNKDNNHNQETNIDIKSNYGTSNNCGISNNYDCSDNYDCNDKYDCNSNYNMQSNVHSVFKNDGTIHKLDKEKYNGDEVSYKNDVRLSTENDKGSASKCSSKTNLLKDSSTIDTNLYKYIEAANEIISYLNLNLGTKYKEKNKGTLILINKRIDEGYTVDDFKSVIDKKVKTWRNIKFEQYLNPQTLFGDKFEIYLNQNIIKEEKKENTFIDYREPRKLRFNNFKGRDYDYDDLEKKLLGWA
ncbi:conserved phage C-terminal domain-containing protein [Clostridium sp.]|uniref:conserved phage C-terminal domain-containing protein n=1 Tax=Clostridium sp. TaxID=1506 RepID=UPI00115C39EB|nr:conserved phage C-terminal domain-containing protein [Clostridium sp.]MDU2155653.1 conserved phage C-terminal domain-containing protein [Clostridium sp.]